VGETNLVALFISVVALFGSIIPSILLFRNSSRRVEAENELDAAEQDKLFADTTKILLEPLMARVKELEIRLATEIKITRSQDSRIRKLESSLSRWRDGATRLILQLKSLNQIPVWTPPDCDYKDGLDVFEEEE
jgi:hypothetical protein